MNFNAKHICICAISACTVAAHAQLRAQADLAPSAFKASMAAARGIDSQTQKELNTRLALQLQQYTKSTRVLEAVSADAKLRDPTIAVEVKSLDTAINSVKAAQAYVNGEYVPPEKLEEIREAVQRAKWPVWILCGGRIWFPKSASPDFAELFKTVGNLKEVATATGMVTTYDHPSGTPRGHQGTAVAVGPNRVLTNRHVIEDAYIGYNDTISGWKLVPTIKAEINFPWEYERCDPTSNPKKVRVVGIEAVHESLDLAILITDGSLPLPVLFPKKADVVNGDRVAVIGYPSRPGDNETFLSPRQIEDIFKSPDGTTPFPVERIATGATLLKANDPGYFSYDATTWAGNSGSVVVNVRTGAVLGLHARGFQAKKEGAGYNEGVLTDGVSAFVESSSPPAAPK